MTLISINDTRKTRVLLVVLEPITLYVYGVRSLSATLNARGFDVRILFLFPTQFAVHSQENVRDFVRLCKEFDVIGFSFTSSQFALAYRLTEQIRYELSGKVVVFGGPGPTVNPNKSLEVADVVCIGEGEESFTEFMLAQDAGEVYPKVRGMWYRKGGVKSPLRPLMRDFSQLPTVDNNFKRHYVTHRGKIVRIEEVANRYLVSNYMTLTSFGCPMNCSYCINSTMKRYWPDWGKVRRRPVDHIIAELKDALEKIPWIRSIDLVDDDFGSAPVEYLREFQSEYIKNVGLPIDVMGLRPPDIVPEKLDILRDMGTVKVRMGIQAVNQEVKKLFKRSYSNDFLMKKVRVLNQYKKAFYGIRYDFIIDTPWDTEEASIETLQFISRMPPPFFVNVYSLALFPGTELYAKALKEGIIHESDVWNGRIVENFMHLKPTWINFLLVIMNLVHIRPKVLDFLLSRKIRENIKTIPNWLFKAAQLFAFAKRWIWYVAHKDYAQVKKIFLYLSEYSFLFRNART